MTIEELVQAIMAGTYDDDTSAIYDALKRRRSIASQAKLAEFRVGQTVRFVPELHAKYGEGGVIKKVNRTRLAVKYSEYGVVTCYPAHIESVVTTP